ncbi:MAG: hypothetical protein A2840_03000 [Candidatus Buchananbacteria bacterium RIFCSPHIGHO2_01_FULL_47_11b]|uniref:Recombination endonuclease VII n=1 Tax=Candidatus Buchananbacteria bacterium RIFCSPHIGHO2_01_FULL_47_11b TaxID=1797537 RepID=A0A1G1Y3J4_9BACT|nr:MAG: hypothetical protein A2840_03000 [Candidatus Buchananbacteria bacterium RIFCSPHIGHO2_01_FULL_47_11b]
MHPLKGRKQTIEHKEKRLKSLRDGGKLKLPRGRYTKERIQKLIDTQRRLGIKPPNHKGKKRSLESIEKGASKRRGIKRPQFSGKNNPMWRGGISTNFKEYMMNYRKHNNEIRAGRKQPEQCEICGVLAKDFKRGLCYDHDHISGAFRGWICTRCNTALGLVKENTETLMALIEYINKHRIKTVNGLA